jgi:hypothetical protein
MMTWPMHGRGLSKGARACPGTIAKEPLDLSRITQSLTTLFRPSRLSTKVLVLTLLHNGEVPNASPPADTASSGTRRLRRPTREPQSATREPTLTCGTSHGWVVVGRSETHWNVSSRRCQSAMVATVFW